MAVATKNNLNVRFNIPNNSEKYLDKSALKNVVYYNFIVGTHDGTTHINSEITFKH